MFVKFDQLLNFSGIIMKLLSAVAGPPALQPSALAGIMYTSAGIRMHRAPQPQQ